MTTDQTFSWMLRVEGAAWCVAALATYASVADGWTTLLLWGLAPDVALAAYALGPVAGARAYNATHHLLGPLLLAAVAPGWLPVAAVWVAHIGMDRALGFGLKSTEGFGVTHLGRVGSG